LPGILGFKEHPVPARGEGVANGFAIAAFGQLMVPVAVFVFFFFTPHVWRYYLAACVPFVILVACNAVDVRHVREGDYADNPPRVLFEVGLALAAAGLLVLAAGSAGADFRPLLVAGLFTAAVVGNRAFVATAWAMAVVAIAVVIWIPTHDVSGTIAGTLLYASFFASTMLVTDFLVRRSHAQLRAGAAISRLATFVGEIDSWPAGITGLGPDLAAGIEVAEIAVFVREEPHDVVEAVSWPTSHAGDEGAMALARSCMDDLAFVCRDGRAGYGARWQGGTLAVVVPDQTMNRVRVEASSLQLLCNLLVTMANHAALIVALVDEATTDPLTGLANRRQLSSQLLQEIERSQRSGQPLTVAMLDIDLFKDFNDTFGHLAGDGMLQSLARSVEAHLRRSDIVCRYGGEEFCAILPDTTATETMKLLADPGRRIVRDDAGREVTFSAGVAQWDGAEDLETLLDRADAALYRAKRAGRDRVEVAA
jgi:diguanylate cyclase (GGDEF)-like protein